VVALVLVLSGSLPDLRATDIKRRWDVGHPVRGIALSPDGEILAVACGLEKPSAQVRLYSVRSFELLATLKGHSEAVTCVVFTPDSKFLVSGGEDNKCVIWDMATRKSTGDFEGHTFDVVALSMNPDGRHLASCSFDRSVVLWDLKTRQKVATLPTQGKAIWNLAYSPDGKLLVGGADDGTLHVWDVPAKKEVVHGKAQKYSPVRGIVFDPDGSRLASCSRDGGLILWETKNWSNHRISEFGSDNPLSLAIAPTGKTLAVGFSSGRVELVDISRPTVRRQLSDDFRSQVTGHVVPISVTFDAHDIGTTALAFSRDGKTLVSGSIDQTVKIWTDLPFQADQANDRNKGKR
jgi:WD40 repeat protein